MPQCLDHETRMQVLETLLKDLARSRKASGEDFPAASAAAEAHAKLELQAVTARYDHHVLDYKDRRSLIRSAWSCARGLQPLLALRSLSYLRSRLSRSCGAGGGEHGCAGDAGGRLRRRRRRRRRWRRWRRCYVSPLPLRRRREDDLRGQGQGDEFARVSD